MNPADIEHLFSLRNEYRSLRYELQNTEILCKALGNPEKSFHSVLIAGTNGKGSVARWLSAMLPEAGLYISPHLERLNERISIASLEIDDADLEEALDTVHQAASEVSGHLAYPPTYFELVTVAAFWYFSSRVRYAVLEVGLGGRLDSTNVVSQDTSVITNIGYDHQEHLGTTLDAIAAEKAGIIKDSEPVVVGQNCDFQCLRDRAAGRIIHAADSIARVKSRGDGLFSVDMQTPVRRYSDLRPQFRGRHQLDNMKVAVRAAECLEEHGWPLDGTRIAQGINEAVWPGRLERFNTKPAFLIDGGHNAAAAEALARYLAEYHPDKVWLIFGGVREKDVRSILKILEPHASQVILTVISNPRSADPHGLALDFPNALLSDGIAEAISYVQEHASQEDTALVTGSLYLAGEARTVLAKWTGSVR